MHISPISAAPSAAMCAGKRNQAAKPATGPATPAPSATATNAAAPSTTALSQAQAVAAEGGRVASTLPFATTGGGLDIRV